MYRLEKSPHSLLPLLWGNFMKFSMDQIQSAQFFSDLISSGIAGSGVRDNLTSNLTFAAEEIESFFLFLFIFSFFAHLSYIFFLSLFPLVYISLC